jgi:hypothetical protein
MTKTAWMRQAVFIVRSVGTQKPKIDPPPYVRGSEPDYSPSTPIAYAVSP